MEKTATKKDVGEWKLFDASGATLGRLSTEIATYLTEKDTPTYERHIDTLQRHAVVINAAKLDFSPRKLNAKMYHSHSWYLGGLTSLTLGQMMEKDPTSVVEAAVKGMLPKNKLQRPRLNRLHVYVDDSHPHPQVKEKK